jgi:uncharacterized protein
MKGGAPLSRAHTPIRQFVLKVHSRCNLACDYCYVYRMADQGWRVRPLLMSGHTVRLAADRIREHAVRHGLSQVAIVLHGGEPLLAGAGYLDRLAATLRQLLAPVSVTLSVQSNGVLLDAALLDVLAEHGVRVAVSLDGDQPAHDQHRRHADGRGSYAEVERGLLLLGTARYRHLFGGLLATVDLAADPVATYRSLLRFGPPRLDFLLPLGNWTSPPPGRPADPASTPYADWLAAIFDQWYSAEHRETDLRMFTEIMHLLLGGESQLESLGLAPRAIAVIETDGTLEHLDALKSAFPGAATTGLRLADSSMDDLLAQPLSVEWRAGLAGLAPTCQTCAVRNTCGGGFYPHRYRAGNGFRNPSVYCPDLFALIHHIRARLVQDIGRLG